MFLDLAQTKLQLGTASHSQTNTANLPVLSTADTAHSHSVVWRNKTVSLLVKYLPGGFICQSAICQSWPVGSHERFVLMKESGGES